jgi:outer membrane protein
MNKVKFFLAAVGMMAMSMVSNAQTTAPLKIGYTNVEYILALMPESKQIESDLKAYSTQLETQLQTKYKEYQTKGEAYQKGAQTMTDVIRADKEKELMNLQSSIEEFQKNAEASLQKKQQALLEPAYKKMQKAIDDVAKENSITYIFNSDAGYGTNAILLHAPESDNISDLVLKKMGVTPPAKGAAAPGVTAPANNTSVAKPAVTPASGKPATKSSKKKN